MRVFMISLLLPTETWVRLDCTRAVRHYKRLRILELAFMIQCYTINGQSRQHAHLAADV